MDGRGLRARRTTHAPPLHKFEPLRRTALNRLFAAVYACAIIALLYRHAQTLLYPATSLLSFSLSLSLLISDLVLAFMWTGAQAFRMCPIRRKEFPENLRKIIKEEDFPGLDVFICTADPYKEPPMNVVNTALSLMAYDYPTEKISVYVSDDGGSAFTLFAFMEAAKFASHWLPFCREHNMMERSPEVYFASTYHSWSPEIEKIKMMYKTMKVKVEHIVDKGEISDEYIVDNEYREAFSKWTDGFTRMDHPAVVQVILDKSKDRDVLGNFLPNLIYVSRQKSKTSPHHFKAGALNVLLRVSAVMTNAPLILTQDCDMYSNDPQTPLRVLCYLLDPALQSKLAYIQFPQRFHGLNQTDIYASEYKREFQINTMGLDGLIGPGYMGSGCFFRRRAFFGGPSTLVQPKIPELSPDHVVDKPINSREILSLAHNVAGCDYENQTEHWGFKVSEPWCFLYVFLFLGAYGQDLLDFILARGTVQRWWNAQRMWMIRALSCYLFSSVEYLLKSLRISTHAFSLTSKVLDDEQSKRYGQGIFEFGVPSPLFVPLTMAAIINLFSFAWGLTEFWDNGNKEGLALQMVLAGFIVLNCLPIYGAIALRSDKGKMPTQIIVISTFLSVALYTFAYLILKQ
ncbi:hypothetical protein SCA6_005471 [Theobroma cacao]